MIVGGGFGGLFAAQALRKAQARLTLVDRQNHHLFQPLLYQVATAALNPSDIASPIRRILRHQKNIEVLLGEVKAIDLATKHVVLPDEQLRFDYLIVATGASHSYFGHDEWARLLRGSRVLTMRPEIRRRVLFAFEAAERELDPGRRHAWLTFVIVGARPTGVELAGAVAEIAHHALARDFRHIDPTQARVILLEGSPRAADLRRAAFGEGTRATRRDARRGPHRADGHEHRSRGVTVGPDRIEARTVLWAAGVAASPWLAPWECRSTGRGGSA